MRNLCLVIARLFPCTQLISAYFCFGKSLATISCNTFCAGSCKIPGSRVTEVWKTAAHELTYFISNAPISSASEACEGKKKTLNDGFL